MFANSPQTVVAPRHPGRFAAILAFAVFFAAAPRLHADSKPGWWWPWPTHDCTPTPTCSPTSTPETPSPTPTDTPIETPTDTISPTPSPTPSELTDSILLTPPTGRSVVGGLVKLKVFADNQTAAVTGGTVSIVFDETYLRVNPPTGNIAVAPGSPYVIVGSPVISPGRIDIAFEESTATPTFFTGPVVTLELQAILDTPLTTVVLDPGTSGFTPAIPLTFLGTGNYEIIPNGRPVGDFDNSGCSDVADWLYMLDNWTLETDLGPPAIGTQDFLNLMDNWGIGTGCAE